MYKSDENGGFGYTSDIKIGGKLNGYVAVSKGRFIEFDVKTPVAEIPWAGLKSHEGIDLEPIFQSIEDAIQANDSLY